MRDHRQTARALLARHRVVRRAVPDVRRVVAACRLVLVHTRASGAGAIHVDVAMTVSGRSTPQARRYPVAPGQVATTPPAPVLSLAHTRTTPPWMVTGPVPVPMSEARPEPVRTTTTRELRHVLAVRREERVPGVDRVVSRPAAADATARGASPVVVEPSDRAAPGWPRDRVTPPAGPTATELARITDHVMSAIDQRLVSYRERLGRG